MLIHKFNPATKVLETTECILSFNKTKYTYWYYDLKNNLVSSHGKKYDNPDRPLSLESRKRIETIYLPKAVIVENF